MTTNFDRVSVDREPNKRIGIGDGDHSYCDNRLTRHNDHIDSRWPLSVASNLVENGVGMASSTQGLPPSSALALQRQLELLKTERLPPTMDNKTRAFLPSSLTLAKHINGKTVAEQLCNGNSFSPTSVMNIKKLKEPAADDEMEVAFAKQNGNYANAWPHASSRPGERNTPENYQQKDSQHPKNQIQAQHQPNELQLQQQQLQNQLEYTLENSLQELQMQNQQQQYTLQNQLQEHSIQQNQQSPLQDYQFQNSQLYEDPDPYEPEEVEFDCLYPRDDHQSSVRFSQSLSVYDNFEDFDYSDVVCSPEVMTRKTIGTNKENNDCKLMFMLQRAKHCWFSRGELKKIKSERKEIVRALRKVNFDPNSIDQSLYELRGLEAYLSPEAIRTTLKKRRETLEMVFTEQNRQRQSEGGKSDVHNIQSASLKASEGFRTRALEVAERDANEALDLYLYDPEVVRLMSRSTEPSIMNCFRKSQDRKTVDESLHEPFGFMEIDDDNAGEGITTDSTLTFWANSSWAERNLMEE